MCEFFRIDTPYIRIFPQVKDFPAKTRPENCGNIRDMDGDWRDRLKELADRARGSRGYEVLCTGIEGVHEKYLRGLIDQTHKSKTPNADKLSAVAEKNGWSYSWIMTGEGSPYTHRGLAEPGAAPIAEGKLTDVDIVAARFLYPEGRADVWAVRDNAVLLLGFAVGDRILVDPKVPPATGDIVVVQIADQETATAETVLRQFRPPFLTPASTDVNLPAYGVDDRNVTVMGVVVGKYKALREPFQVAAAPRAA